MIKILFVCHGNICRSPMAEFILKDMVRRRGIADRFEIASAATSTEEIWRGVGNPVYPPAKEILREHGIDCSGKRARLLEAADYDRYDLLIGMDAQNMRNMARILGPDREGKVFRLLSFAGSDASVADPWYTDDFETTWKDIVRGCEALLDDLETSGRLY